MSLSNFGEVMTGRLYVTALKNSLILGAWTGLFSLMIGVALAWAVSRTDVPGKALIQVDRQPVLPFAAVPHRHRLRLSVQPERRPDQRAGARRARPAVSHLQRVLHDRAGAGHGAAHLPVRLSAGIERSALGRCLLRGGGADPRREQASDRVQRHGAAGRAGDPVGHAARLRQRHRAVRLAGDHRSARPDRHAADAHLCAVRLSAGVRARLRAVAGIRRHHRGRALSAARVPGAALLCYARGQGRAAAADVARAGALGGVRLCRCSSSSSRSCCRMRP